ncbi:MAG: repeat containing protein, partial [Acidobacteria bacterium]|nr:repeat containing protein [Acidobacteriota bacterium]
MQLRSALRLMSVCLLAILPAGFAEAMTFVHLAGTRGGRGYEDGPAADARFFDASSISSDNAGNLYVSDYINCTLRKILPTGEVQTLAGMKGMPGTTDGRRSAARFWSPLGTAVDSHGNIFVIDSGWNIIRKVTPDGLVTTFAGSPVASGSHADGPGAAARFTYPQAIAVDNNDNLYVGDYSRLRKITPDGNVTTLAGDGTNGVVNGTGTAAEFYNIGGIAFDASTNSLVITETQHSVVRRVTLPDAVVTTIAGKVGVNGHTNANGLNAVFQSLGGIAVNSSGYMWVTETTGTIRTISPAGDVAELAGQYFAPGSIDGVGSAARFSGPFNIAINKLTGGIYVADSYTIRQLSGATVTTFAGTLPRSGIVNGTGTAATFRAPSGLAFDSVNSLLYVADRENSVIRRVTVPAGEVTTFAGNGSSGNVNGNGTAASFGRPQGVALNPADGSLFVADTDMNSIRRIAMNGDVTLWAGSATGASGSANGGRLTTARFYGPQALAFDPPRSRLYVADAYNHKLRVIDITTGAVSDVIDAATAQPVSFGTLSVDNVAVEGSGNVYAGAGNKITKISATGNVSVLAGPGDNFIPGTAVDGTGSQARFAFPGPSTVAVDASGNGYVADIWGGTIRSITSAGVVQTVGGNWNRSGSADGTDAFAEFQ